jgi:hypothetical protein
MQNNAGRSQNCEKVTISFIMPVRLSSLKFLKLPEDDSGMSKHVGVNIIQCVPLATELGISLHILLLMKILQRNLKHATDTHYRHALQTRTTDTLQTHYRHALQTHTTDTLQTRTADTYYRHTLQTHTTDTFVFISHTTNVLLFKFRCNIFIGVRIIKEMPGSVASGTLCIMRYCCDIYFYSWLK